MIIGKLVKNYQDAVRQVYLQKQKKEEFDPKEQVMDTVSTIMMGETLDFLDWVTVYYLFILASSPLMLLQMFLIVPAVYLVLHQTHPLKNSYINRAIWITLVVLLSFFAPGVYYIYYLIRYALGRRPVKGSNDLIPEIKFSDKSVGEQLKMI